MGSEKTVDLSMCVTFWQADSFISLVGLSLRMRTAANVPTSRRKNLCFGERFWNERQFSHGVYFRHKIHAAAFTCRINGGFMDAVYSDFVLYSQW